MKDNLKNEYNIIKQDDLTIEDEQKKKRTNLKNEDSFQNKDDPKMEDNLKKISKNVANLDMKMTRLTALGSKLIDLFAVVDEAPKFSYQIILNSSFLICTILVFSWVPDRLRKQALPPCQIQQQLIRIKIKTDHPS